MTDLEALLEDIRARLAHAADGLLTPEEALVYIEKDLNTFEKKQQQEKK